MPTDPPALHEVVWDVIVVGAGPAGSSAARVAAASGAKVLLLDRAAFPRYKTCGGGILGVSERYLPDAVLPLIEVAVDETKFTLGFEQPFRLSRKQPFLGMVQREDFDQALVDEAVAAGAVFRDGVSVRGLKEVTGQVTVRTSGESLSARIVIGADGSSGRVGRYVGVECGEIDLGLEEEIATPAEWQGSAVLLDWGTAPGTYAWVFPKRGSLTVGVIQRRGSPDETRDYLAKWKTHLGLDDGEILAASGHLTQWRTPSSPLRRGRIIVAGDAAGLLEPWTREGISFALRSGTWAGEAAAAAVRVRSAATGSDAATARSSAMGALLADYEKRVRRELGAEQTVGAALLAVFERRPKLVHFALRRIPFAQEFFIRFCRGETSLARLGRNRGVLWVLRRLGAS